MANDSIADEVRDTMEHQLKELRGQLAHITRSLKDSGFDIEDVRDEARGLISGASHNAQKVARYAQHEAGAVARTAQRNPAGTGTVLTLAALIGFGLGIVYSQSQIDRRHWW